MEVEVDAGVDVSDIDIEDVLDGVPVVISAGVIAHRDVCRILISFHICSCVAVCVCV